MTDKWWTIAEVAAHLGITEKSARAQLSRWGIAGERHYPGRQVAERHESRPGRGKGGGRPRKDANVAERIRERRPRYMAWLALPRGDGVNPGASPHMVEVINEAYPSTPDVVYSRALAGAEDCESDGQRLNAAREQLVRVGWVFTPGERWRMVNHQSTGVPVGWRVRVRREVQP